jgi:hypothetical protein
VLYMGKFCPLKVVHLSVFLRTVTKSANSIRPVPLQRTTFVGCRTRVLKSNIAHGSKMPQ